MLLISKNALIITVIIVVVTSYPICALFSIEENYNNQAFHPSGSINSNIIIPLKFDEGKTPPSEMRIEEGEIVQGGLYSLYSSSGELTVNLTNGLMIMYLAFEARSKGTLAINCFYNSTLITASLMYYNPESSNFEYAGSLSDEYIKLDDIAVSDEGKILVKIKAIGTSGSTISFREISYNPDPYNYYAEFNYFEYDNLIHAKTSFYIYKVHTKVIFTKLPKSWVLSWSNFPVKWNFSIPGFEANITGNYILDFLVTDEWDVPKTQVTKIVALDTSYNRVDLDNLKVLYRILRPAANPNEWNFVKNITLQNPMQIDLYNVTETVTLSSENFNFFSVKPNLSDLMFKYRGNIVPHYITYWNGLTANIKVKIPIIEANSTDKLELYFGCENISNTFPLDSMYMYKSDMDSLSNWVIKDGNWTIKFDTGLNSNVAYTNATLDTSLLLLNKSLPMQIISNYIIKIDVYPSQTDLIFLYDTIGNYYFFRLDFTQTLLGDKFLFISVYRKSSSGIQKIVDYPGGIEINDLNDILNISLQLSPSYAVIEIVGKTSKIYNFGTSYLDFYKIGIGESNGTISIDKVTIKNFYSEVLLSNVSTSSKRLNIHYIKTSYTRLFTDTIKANKSDKLNIVIYDYLNQIVYNETVEPKDSLILKTDLIKVNFVMMREYERANIVIDNGLISASTVLTPYEKWVIYLKNSSNYLININYTDTRESYSFNVTLFKDQPFYLTGKTIVDILSFLDSVSKNISYQNELDLNKTSIILNRVNEINASIDSLYGFLEFNLRALNSSIDQVQKSLDKIDLTLLSLQDNLTKIKSTVNTSLADLSIIKDNLSNIYDLMIIINNTSARVSKNLTYILNNTLQNMSDRIVRLNDSLNLTFYITQRTLEEVNKTEKDIYALNSTISIYTMDTVQRLNDTMILLIQIGQLVNQTKQKIDNLMLTLNESTSDLNKSIETLSMEIIKFNKSVNLLENMSLQIFDKLELLENYNNLLHDSINETIKLINILNSTISTKIELYMEFLNETISIRLLDRITGIETVITSHFYNITYYQLKIYDFLTNTLINSLRPKDIRLINSLNGKEIDSDLIFLEVNGYKLERSTMLVLQNEVSIRVLDYWEREIYRNVSDEIFIDIKIPMGTLTIVNDKPQVLRVKIRPVEILDKYYVTYIRGLDYLEQTVPLGSYLILIENIEGEKILEETVELKYSKVTDAKDPNKVIYIGNTDLKHESNLIPSETLYYMSPAIVLIPIYFIYRKRRAIQKLEIDEDFDDF